MPEHPFVWMDKYGKNVYLCQVGPLAATYQNIFLLPSIPTVSEGKKLVPIVLKIYAGAKEVCI